MCTRSWLGIWERFTNKSLQRTCTYLLFYYRYGLRMSAKDIDFTFSFSVKVQLVFECVKLSCWKTLFSMTLWTVVGKGHLQLLYLLRIAPAFCVLYIATIFRDYLSTCLLRHDMPCNLAYVKNANTTDFFTFELLSNSTRSSNHERWIYSITN